MNIEGAREFRAFRIHDNNGSVQAGLETLGLADLMAGEVVIRAEYSSVNYKDALAATGRGRILRRFPLVGGIDVSGIVEGSTDERYPPGTPVLVTGCGMGENHDGGFAQYVRVPAQWVVPLPQGLDLYEAMALGTAGFTVALAVQRLEENGQVPSQGPVLVTGATGGVGSLAIDILSGLGYEVVALSGKPGESAWLQSLGAARVLDRRGLDTGSKPLERAQWAGAVDNAGGETLAWLTRTVQPGGNIVSIGLAGGSELHTTVMPFILRGISLLGVASASCPMSRRCGAWERLATDLRPHHLDRIVQEPVTLDGLSAVFDRMMQGKTKGRVLVRLQSDQAPC